MRTTLLTLTVLLLCVGAGTIQAQPLLTVAEARYDGDEDGIPDLLGDTLTIEAVATCEGTLFSSGSSLSFYVQDETAGINVYSYDEHEPPGGIEAGDELSITGTIGFYNGLTEMMPIQQMTVIGTAPVPSPLQLVLHQGVSESIEGLLLALGNQSSGQWVTVSTTPELAGGGYNFDVWNGETSVAVRVEENTGINVSAVYPGARFFLIGIGGQYDPEPPYNTGYQILPRYQSDLIPYSPTISQSFHLEIMGAPFVPGSTGNPFAPCIGEVTYIEYGGPSGMTFTLTVYDRSGRAVAHLAESRSSGDVVQWDGRDDNDDMLPIGPYLMQLVGIDQQGDRFKTTETVVIAAPLGN
jgi:hypothetical protein